MNGTEQGLVFLMLWIGNSIYAGIKSGIADGWGSGLASFLSWLVPSVTLIGVSVAISFFPDRRGGGLIFVGGAVVAAIGGIIWHLGSEFVDPKSRQWDFTGSMYAPLRNDAQRDDLIRAKMDSDNWYWRYSHSLHIVLGVTGAIAACFGLVVVIFPSVARALVRLSAP